MKLLDALVPVDFRSSIRGPLRRFYACTLVGCIGSGLTFSLFVIYLHNIRGFSRVARHLPSGEFVGFSELSVSRERPRTAHQRDTLVVRAHRGHHLAGLKKIAAMRELDAVGYPTRTVITSNNPLNTAMVAVNSALGDYPTDGIVKWRKVLD